MWKVAVSGILAAVIVFVVTRDPSEEELLSDWSSPPPWPIFIGVNVLANLLRSTADATLQESTSTPQGCSGVSHMEFPSPGRSTTPNPWPRMAAPALTRHRSRAGAQVAREAPEF